MRWEGDNRGQQGDGGGTTHPHFPVPKELVEGFPERVPHCDLMLLLRSAARKGEDRGRGEGGGQKGSGERSP